MPTELRAISQEDVKPLYAMAEAEGHDIWQPTHIIEKDGEMMGSVSIDGIPMCTAFVSREISSPFVLRSMVKETEEIIRNYGDRGYFLCVGPNSPAHRFMPRGGYAGFKTDLWYKELK